MGEGEGSEEKAAVEVLPGKDKIFSVAQLSKAIRKNLLSNNPLLESVWIEGEISGFKTYSSGHSYFSLKDDQAVISCVLFSFMRARCPREFIADLAAGDETVNGQKVLVKGQLELNLARGQYSFKISALRRCGSGDKMAEYNARKEWLEKNGLNKLDHPELRRSLPFLPRRIGIVTSAAGAVIHDMCNVLGRRYPNLDILLFPVKVQGEGAAREIAAGIEFFQKSDWRPDVLIVARGGGSAEDLWPFNEEAVVMAVAKSSIPVISAVGHESDVTLCDHAADLRAGTPSIGAELAVPVKAELEKRVEELAGRMLKALEQTSEARAMQLDNMTDRLENLLSVKFADAQTRLRQAMLKLTPSLKDALNRAENRMSLLAQNMELVLNNRVRQTELVLKETQTRLRLLNPYAVLERGYSITCDASGGVIRSAAQAKSGERIVTRFADGALESVVESKPRKRKSQRSAQ